MNPWEKGVLASTIILTGMVLVKLWSTGLVKFYKLLFSFLAFDFATSIAAVSIPYRTTEYAYFYFVSQTVKVVIAALVVVEIYGLALEYHQALARFVRDAVGYILAGAALIPALVLLLDGGSKANPHPLLAMYFRFEQTMDGTMAIFLILISGFMAWFPVRLRRNVLVYITGFVVWMLSRSGAVYLTKHFLGNESAVGMVNSVEVCVPVVCLMFWLLGLRPVGETRTAVVGHLWNRQEAERLTKQLDEINDSLERLRRK